MSRNLHPHEYPQEDIVCPIIASDGMPIVTELGAAVVHLKCIKQAYLTARWETNRIFVESDAEIDN